MDTYTVVNTRRTPQTQRANVRQSRNNAGGYVFTITPEQQLRRFLTLGSASNTYYSKAGDLTRENAKNVFAMAETDHKLLVDTIVEVSIAGRAPRQQPALFALAIAASVGSSDEKRYALSKLSEVARTGTAILTFAKYVEQFRGWGRGLRTAVGDWYLTKQVDALAYQTVKYRQRDGWSHRDLLRLSHPDPYGKMDTKALFEWITKGDVGEYTPRLIEGFLKAQDGENIPALINEYGLSWEMLPDSSLNDVKVWDALLDNGLPQTALIRQLPRLTRLGMLPQMGGRTAEVVGRLTDQERLHKARIHPMNALVAHLTYTEGRSERGSSTWTPNPKIADALNDAFYLSFKGVEPSNKRTMLALDVSGSMSLPRIAGMPLTPRDASAAMALITAATEPDYGIFGFTSSSKPNGGFGSRSNDGAFVPLSISPRQRLKDVIRNISGLPFSGTDCALPMIHAAKMNMEVDTFVVYTDSETWAGGIHPYQALRDYRQKMGIDAKLVVVGMTATNFSIADPRDNGMLDVAGFDTAVPNLITDFSLGRI